MSPEEANIISDQIMSRANSVMIDYYSKLSEEVQKDKAKAEMLKIKDRGQLIRPCPTTDHTEDMSEEEKAIASAIVDNITEDFETNKAQYGGEDEATHRYTGGSKEATMEQNEIELVRVQSPKWIKLLRKHIATIFQRARTKEYYDVESLPRGVLRRTKTMGKSKTELLFLVMDTSGSMFHYSVNDIPLIQLVASYVPPIAKQYNGFWVQVDGPHIVFEPLKKFKKHNVNTLKLAGGGGADFEAAFREINEYCKNHGVKKYSTILMSDMDEHYPVLPENTIVVTTPQGLKILSSRGDSHSINEQGFPNASKNQFLISIE